MMSSRLRPVQFKTFIDALQKCDVLILSSGEDAFTAFQRGGSTYWQTPNGPFCPIIRHPWNTMMPVEEIRTILKHLEISEDVFYNEISSLQKAEGGLKPSQENDAISGQFPSKTNVP